MNKVIRIFPRKTNMTPNDAYSFVGDPPLWRPEADEVHVSVTFTWDIEEGKRLQEAWKQYYPNVLIGGPAMRNKPNGFIPGLYMKTGVTFTSRGCNNNCPWCLVPKIEGKLYTIPIVPGHIIQDNNLLQCSAPHRRRVFQMLDSQNKAANFLGGLDARLITDEIAEELRGLRIHQVFLAADTEGALKPLKRAIKKLSFLPRQKLRCYVLVAYNDETVEQATARLCKVWESGAMPFVQLYQPPDQYIKYSYEWRSFARRWQRPAIIKAMMSQTKRKECLHV